MSWCTTDSFIREGYVGKVKGGKYCIKKKLNTGEFAHSYYAQDKNGNEYFFKAYVEPKKINGQVFYDFKAHLEKMKEQLKKVPDAAAQIIDVFVEKSTIFTVHTFLKGKDLSKFIEEGNMSLEQKWIFSTVFVSALSRIHEAGIVHVDLKPEQIFLEEAPEIKIGWKIFISDFDFSWIYENGKVKSKPHIVVKTQGFQSPEHIKGENPTFASDVFTAGIIIFKTLFDAHPFHNRNGISYEDAVKQELIIFNPRQKFKWVPEKISELVLRALSWNKSKRPSAQELRKAFQDEINHSIPPWVAQSKGKDIEELRKSSAKSPTTATSNIYYKRVRIGDKILVWSDKVIEAYYLKRFFPNLNVSGDVFEVKKINGIWMLRAFPPKISSSKVTVNGVDATNKWLPLVDGGEIKIGNMVLKIKLEK